MICSKLQINTIIWIEFFIRANLLDDGRLRQSQDAFVQRVYHLVARIWTRVQDAV
jgi:hypothetical protein